MTTFNARFHLFLRLMALATLVIPLLASQPTRAATVPPLKVFLPMVVKPAPPALNLTGHVTLNGVDASGVFLQLLLYSNYSMSPVASTRTAADGTYLFSPKQLSPGQEYIVEFNNSSAEADGRLYSWDSTLATYESGQNVKNGDFDLADVTLISPAPAAAVTLPVTFQWHVRPATPGDSYRFELDDSYSTLCNVFTTNLGYTNSYTLNSLADGCTSTSANNYWTVWVDGENGGSGQSFYYFSMTFSNHGSSVPDFMTTRAQRSPLDLTDYLNRRVVP